MKSNYYLALYRLGMAVCHGEARIPEKYSDEVLLILDAANQLIEFKNRLARANREIERLSNKKRNKLHD